jgi:hypothetical protein
MERAATGDVPTSATLCRALISATKSAIGGHLKFFDEQRIA